MELSVSIGYKIFNIFYYLVLYGFSTLSYDY